VVGHCVEVVDGRTVCELRSDDILAEVQTVDGEVDQLGDLLAVDKILAGDVLKPLQMKD